MSELQTFEQFAGWRIESEGVSHREEECEFVRLVESAEMMTIVMRVNYCTIERRAKVKSVAEGGDKNERKLESYIMSERNLAIGM